MITVITGLPGNGKTLFALFFVKAWAEREGRPVFFHGIKDLKLPWQPIDPQKWYEAPARAIVLIDEAQNCGFGVRPRGQVPEHAQKLETHRHLGIDLVFITQAPMLLDAHDRQLAERHYHVVRKFGMQRATVHEFSPVRDTVLKSRKDSIRHEFKYPREVFGWYTSAEAHTHKRHIPMRVKVFFALPVLLAGLGWFTWAKYLDPKREKAPVKDMQGHAVSAKPGAGAAAGPAVKTPVEYVASFEARVPGLAYTAPVYDEVTKPVEAPYPAACVQSKSRCQCYTQQGTRLSVPASLCSSIVDGGFFVAWAGAQAPQTGMPAGRPVAEVTALPGAVSLGGSRTQHYTAMTGNTSSVVTGVVEQAPAAGVAARAKSAS